MRIYIGEFTYLHISGCLPEVSVFEVSVMLVAKFWGGEKSLIFSGNVSIKDTRFVAALRLYITLDILNTSATVI